MSEVSTATVDIPQEQLDLYRTPTNELVLCDAAPFFYTVTPPLEGAWDQRIVYALHKYHSEVGRVTRLVRIYVEPPLSRPRRSWERLDDSALGHVSYESTQLDLPAATWFAVMFKAAANKLYELTEAKKEEVERIRAEEEREQAAREERRRVEREQMARAREERIRLATERKEKALKLAETLKWHVDEKFRLRRRGHRSTVFGTIQEVQTPSWRMPYLQTISEKRVAMQIDIADITAIEIKTGPRSYDRIFTADDYDGKL